MFEDTQNQNAQQPSAVPQPPTPPREMSNEPEDIFAEVNTGGTPVMLPQQPMSNPPVRRGANKMLLVVALIVVLVIIVGVGGYVIFRNVSQPTPAVNLEDSDTNETTEVSQEQPTIEEPSTEEMIVEEGTPDETSTPELDTTQETDIQGGAEVDTDGDGLSDSTEEALGTDPLNLDTDEDGLFDGEEVNKYFTNPINPDTDGDTFPDGSEVANGYDPNGPGRLFELP